jgi:hypothetical protein
MPRNVLEEGFDVMISFIQAYAWYAIAVALILYFNWSRITEFRKARSLAEANDPQRRSALDAQRLRIRLEQQKALDHVD